jgi:tight adherence protein B
MRPAVLSGLISAGVPLATAVDLADPRQLPEKFRQFIALAFELGAPLVPTLSQLEVQLRHEERSAQEVSQAQAVPQATRTLLLWLPPVAFLMSQIMGLASLKGLLHPVGMVAALLAAALLGLGHKISGKMLATFDEMRPDPTHSLMVLRICLAAGEPLSKIEARLAKLDPGVATELIELSKKTGAKLAALIDSELEQLNQKLLSERIEAARRLSVRLLIPLSLTTLPAFLLLTLPPIIIGFTQ